MRRIGILLILVSVLLGSALYAAPEHDSKTQQSKIIGLRFEPLLLALGGLDLRLGVKTSERTSIVFALDGHFFWPPLPIAPPKDLWGLGGGIGFHWTPCSPVYISGFYIEPIVRSGYSGLVPNKSHFVIIPSIESGYKWQFNNGVVLNTGLSVNYIVAPNLGNNWMPNFPVPLLHFGLGYVW